MTENGPQSQAKPTSGSTYFRESLERGALCFIFFKYFHFKEKKDKKFKSKDNVLLLNMNISWHLSSRNSDGLQLALGKQICI